MADMFFEEFFPFGFGLTRLTADGLLDDDFGENGFSHIDLDKATGGWHYATCLAQSADGEIVIAGWTGNNIVLARYFFSN
jgi:hypothetical protein